MNILKQKLIFDSLAIVFFTNLANLFSLFFQIFIGRNLSLNDYGLVTSFYSFFSIVALPAVVIPFIVSTYLFQEKSKENQNKFLSSMLLIFLIFSVIETLILVLGKNFFFILLKFDSSIFLYLIIILQFLVFLMAVLIGVLISEAKYKTYSILGSLPLYLRFLFLLLIINLTTFKLDIKIVLIVNILAVLINILLMIVFGNIKLNFLKFIYNDFISYIKKIFLLSLPLIGCFSIIIFLQNIDAILIRYLYSNEFSGIISSSIVLSKIPFFMFSALIYMIFPEVKKNIKFLNFINFRNFFYFCFTILILTAIYLFLLNTYSELILNLIFGNRYLSASNFIEIHSLYYIQLSLFIILSSVSLAIENFKVFIKLFFVIFLFIFFIIVLNVDISVLFILINLKILMVNLLLIFSIYKFKLMKLRAK